MSEKYGANRRKSTINGQIWIYLIFKKSIWPKMRKFRFKKIKQQKNIMYILHNILIRKKNLGRVNRRKQEKTREKHIKTSSNQL